MGTLNSEIRIITVSCRIIPTSRDAINYLFPRVDQETFLQALQNQIKKNQIKEEVRKKLRER